MTTKIVEILQQIVSTLLNCVIRLNIFLPCFSNCEFNMISKRLLKLCQVIRLRITLVGKVGRKLGSGEKTLIYFMLVIFLNYKTKPHLSKN